MSNCKNCNAKIELKQGRRPREFCDNNQKCRNEYFRKNKKSATHKTIPIEQWEEIQKKLKQVGKPITESQNKADTGDKKVNMGNTQPKEETPVNTPEMSEYERKEALERIPILENEIKNPPKNMSISKKLYLSLREDELKTLKNKLL